MNEESSASKQEHGVLDWLFSGNATAKLLEFLVTAQDFDISATDIAKSSQVSPKTVFRELPKFELVGLVKHTRNVGRAKMYRLNQNSDEAKLLTRLVLGLAAKRNEYFVKDIGPQYEIVTEEFHEDASKEEKVIANTR